jgi:hypothetical protein
MRSTHKKSKCKKKKGLASCTVVTIEKSLLRLIIRSRRGAKHFVLRWMPC